MRFIPAVLTVLTMNFAWGEELPPQGARILHRLLRSVLLRARRRSNDNLWQVGGLPPIVYWGLVVVRWRPSSQAF